MDTQGVSSEILRIQQKRSVLESLLRDTDDDRSCYTDEASSMMHRSHSSVCLSPEVLNQIDNQNDPSNVVNQNSKMKKPSLKGIIDPIHSKYNLLQVKPRKPRKGIHHSSKGKRLNRNDHSSLNDPKFNEQLEDLICNVFNERGVDIEIKGKNQEANLNQCRPYNTPEFEKFTKTQKENILRFPYMVNRISKSYSSKRIQQNVVKPSFNNKQSNENFGPIKFDRVNWKGNSSQSQNDCINLCNHLMNSIERQLNSTSSDQSPKNYSNDEELGQISTGTLCYSDKLDSNIDHKTLHKIEKSTVEQRSCYSCNCNLPTCSCRGKLLRESTATQNDNVGEQHGSSVDRSHFCKSNIREVDSNSNTSTTQTDIKINESRKKEFLDSFFGFDKVKKPSKIKNTCPVSVEENKFTWELNRTDCLKISAPEDNNFPEDSQNYDCIKLNRQRKSMISATSKLDESQNSARQESEMGLMYNERQCNPIEDNRESPLSVEDFPSGVPDVKRRISISHIQNMPMVEQENENQEIEHLNNYDTNISQTSTNPMIDNDLLTRQFQRCNDIIEFNPQLSFLLEKTSNFYPPSNCLLDQSVYFCDVTNSNQRIPQNFTESAKYKHEVSNTKEVEKSFLYEKPNTSSFPIIRIDNPIITEHKKTFMNPKYVSPRKSDYQCESSKYSSNPDYENQIHDVSHLDQDHEYDQDDLHDRNSFLNRNSTTSKLSYCCCDETTRRTSNSQVCNGKYIENCAKTSKHSSTNFQQNHPISEKGSILQNVVSQMDNRSLSTSDHLPLMKIKNHLAGCPEERDKGTPQTQLVSLDEPEYLQHLKKLRWDHLQRISREVHRLESLERFLDACGCGHIMAL